MAEYNKLSEVTYNPKVRSWCFRVKLHRIYPFYSYVTNSGPYYNYILADEDLSYTYMVDTMGVVFNTEVHLDAPTGPRMEFYIRDNIDHQIKCLVTGDQAYAFRDGLDHMSAEGRRQVIVVLKMWRVRESMSYFGPPDIWLETEGGFADFRFNPRLPEVEEFRQSLLNSDPYVQKYGVEGLL
ncbi:hypothetical protein Bca101_009953 [Brassica carinata]